MKVGITINKYYDSYIEEIANLNGMTKTRVCSLILENWLSYNKDARKIPVFKPYTGIVYAKKSVGEITFEEDVFNDDIPVKSREQLLKELEDDDNED